MIRGLTEGVLGIGNYNVRAPTIDTRAGTNAINTQARLGADAANSAGYSLAASARGGSAPMALREAQRRGALAQQQLAGQAMGQASQLEQNVASQNAQMQMQANMANMQAKQQSDAAFMGMMGSMGGAAMMASDERAKADILPLEAHPRPAPAVSAFPRPIDPAPYEMEDPDRPQLRAARYSSFRPVMHGLGGDYSGFDGRDMQADLERRSMQSESRNRALAADAYEKGPSAIQVLGLSPEDAKAAYLQSKAGLPTRRDPETGGPEGSIPRTSWDTDDSVRRWEAWKRINPNGPVSDVRAKTYAPTPDAPIVMSDAHSKSEISSLREMNKFLASQLRMAEPKPRPTADMLPSQQKEYADSFARHEAARREAMKDMMGQAIDDDRRERLVNAARGTGPQPDVITENPGPGQVARGYSYPLTAGEQSALELNALKSSGVLRPEEAGVGPSAPVHAVTSDREAKMEAREMGRAEGEEAAFRAWYERNAKRNRLDPNPDDPRHHYDYRAAFRAGAGPGADGHWPSEFKADDHPNRYVNGEDTKYGLPAPAPASLPSGSMERPNVRQPDFAALDAANGRREEHPAVEAMAAIPASTWRYRPEHVPDANARMGLPPDDPYGAKRKASPMAQDLEQNELTSGAVATGPDGLKRVDAGQLTMTNTAALSDLARFAEENDRRLRRLEATRGRVKYPRAEAPR